MSALSPVPPDPRLSPPSVKKSLGKSAGVRTAPTTAVAATLSKSQQESLLAELLAARPQQISANDNSVADSVRDAHHTWLVLAVHALSACVHELSTQLEFDRAQHRSQQSFVDIPLDDEADHVPLTKIDDPHRAFISSRAHTIPKAVISNARKSHGPRDSGIDDSGFIIDESQTLSPTASVLWEEGNIGQQHRSRDDSTRRSLYDNAADDWQEQQSLARRRAAEEALRKLAPSHPVILRARTGHTPSPEPYVPPRLVDQSAQTDDLGFVDYCQRQAREYEHQLLQADTVATMPSSLKLYQSIPNTVPLEQLTAQAADSTDGLDLITILKRRGGVAETRHVTAVFEAQTMNEIVSDVRDELSQWILRDGEVLVVGCECTWSYPVAYRQKQQEIGLKAQLLQALRTNNSRVLDAVQPRGTVANGGAEPLTMPESRVHELCGPSPRRATYEGTYRRYYAPLLSLQHDETAPIHEPFWSMSADGSPLPPPVPEKYLFGKRRRVEELNRNFLFALNLILLRVGDLGTFV